MKRMVYIVISFTGILLALIVFAGCSAPSLQQSKSLVGMSLNQNHMDFGYCYSFYLRQEEGKVLFDAEVRFNEEPYAIILESVQVDEECMEKLIKLNAGYKITDYVTSYKKKKLPFAADDETVNKTTVYLSDGTSESADTKAEHIDVLYDFFFELARQYASESVYTMED